jgi:hypothetical protein
MKGQEIKSPKFFCPRNKNKNCQNYLQERGVDHPAAVAEEWALPTGLPEWDTRSTKKSTKAWKLLTTKQQGWLS